MAAGFLESLGNQTHVAKLRALRSLESQPKTQQPASFLSLQIEGGSALYHLFGGWSLH